MSLLPPGSSPRRRGTLRLAFSNNYSAWIIPAQAGNTPHPLATAWSPADHPRAGGEHLHVRQSLRA